MPSPEDVEAAPRAPPTVEDDEEFDEDPLGRTAIDPYGRRSMAFQVRKTGQIITSTGKQTSMPASLLGSYTELAR